ncbi:NlpC/P60 family protein [Actinomadura violacea]|uniref:C40 family peptidase n=1 Tax=Actinomadura violacea TaxID=2819934 RepID=A0ABS3RRM7_9ACTN|nr:NlpC/P60 family protein [Actinomadura violacea]MBO2459373.1 C40 family peptidase [Actinomadura violacea]
MPVNLVALGAIATGSVFTYAGVKGLSIPDAVQSIVQGKSPANLPQKYGIDAPVSTPPATGSTAVAGGTATGQAIANDGLKYNGQGYHYGGPADKPGNWDCSSFVSYVLGHDLGQPLPGGKWGDPGFPPHAHGPTTREYQGFGRSIGRADVAAGDLIVWPDHIGIAINNKNMINARSTATGTGLSSIDGTTRYFHTEPVYRRVGA